jgi:hypothetical protein
MRAAQKHAQRRKKPRFFAALEFRQPYARRLRELQNKSRFPSLTCVLAKRSCTAASMCIRSAFIGQLAQTCPRAAASDINGNKQQAY